MSKANTVACLAVWLLIYSCVASAADYDKYAYIKTLPTEPIFPTQQRQCDDWQKRSESRVQEVNVAHSGCLRTETSTKLGDLPSDEKDVCTKPACQELHKSLSSLRTEVSAKYSACTATVEAHEKKARQAERDKQRSRLEKAQDDPCTRDKLQYDALCTGNKFDSSAEQKRCSKDLKDIQKRCPGPWK